MKKRKQSKVTPKPRRRFSITSIMVAAVIVGAATITVVSKQLANRNTARSVAAKATTVDTAKKFVTVKVAGREVQVDPQTGQIKPLTPEEAKQLADGLKTMLNTSTDGLEPVKNADGSVSMDLKGRFKNVALARVNEDGTLEQTCVDEPLQAAQFFGIDPKLVGVATAAGAPVVRTPAKKVSR